MTKAEPPGNSGGGFREGDRDYDSRLRFGAFVLDLQKRKLYSIDGNRIRLSPKPFDTLAFLAENPGKIIEKQTLLDAVWRNSFVTEDTMVKAVGEIRRVLGDDKDDPQFIQTIPGEGYRFVAEVIRKSGPEFSSRTDGISGSAVTAGVIPPANSLEEAGTARTQDQTVAVKMHSKTSSRHILLTLSSIALCLVILASVIWWHPSKSTASPTQRLISTFPGAHSEASLSPDAGWIAFTRPDAKGEFQIWIKNLAQGDPQQVTFEGGSRPRWSPKNDQILFHKGLLWKTIWSVPPLGGPPRLLIAGGQHPDGSKHSEGGMNPSFSWDGSQFVFERAGEIWIANADGSGQVRVEGVPRGDNYAMAPAISPDRSTIAFFCCTNGPIGDIWLIPSQGGVPHQLTFDEVPAGEPIWTPDGQHIIFSSSRGGSRTLWKVPVTGGEPRPVLQSAGEDTNPEVSRDGSKLIYTTVRNKSALTVLDPATHQKRELRETGTGMLSGMLAPVFSPDGEKIAFSAWMDEGELHLFLVDRDGRNLTQLTRGKGERNIFPKWYADGSSLYFYRERPSPSLRRISIRGGPSVELIQDWSFATHDLAHIDPYGKIIAFSPSGDYFSSGTFFRDIATGKETLFRKPMRDPQWSPDGKSILGIDVVSGDRGDPNGDIVVCSASETDCRKLASVGNRPIWSHDGSRVYFGRDNQGLFAVSIDGSGERLVADLKPTQEYNRFWDVSRNGEVVYVQFKAGQPELWMMDSK